MPTATAARRSMCGLTRRTASAITTMANGHDKAVALFESASQQPQMPGELKQFAASTLPTLEQHQEMAHSLHQN